MPASSGTSVVTDPGPPGSDDARQAYVEHSARVLQLETDRSDRVEARAGLIVRTNVSLIAAGLAVAAFLLGNNKSLHTGTAWAFALGVVLLTASTALALPLQGKALQSSLTSIDTLHDMQSAWWHERSHTHALHDVMKRNVSAIESLRPRTTDRAKWSNKAFYAQQAAVVALIAAGAIEVWLRTCTN